jgi:hypothetical protein
MISWGKGITLDGFSDTWMKKTERSDLLADLWNKKAISDLASIFEARLIPLKKVWLDTLDQLGPIVVLSPVFKWLE